MVLSRSQEPGAGSGSAKARLCASRSQLARALPPRDASPREATPARQCLEEVGWAQPPARARAGSAAAEGFTSSAAKPKRSKAFGRQLWRLKDRVELEHFEAAREAGACSLAGCPAKHHFSTHLKKARPIYKVPKGSKGM